MPDRISISFLLVFYQFRLFASLRCTKGALLLTLVFAEPAHPGAIQLNPFWSAVQITVFDAVRVVHTEITFWSCENRDINDQPGCFMGCDIFVTPRSIDRIRILHIEHEPMGNIHMQIFLFKYIPPQQPPCQARLSWIPRIRIWSIRQLPLGFNRLSVWQWARGSTDKNIELAVQLLISFVILQNNNKIARLPTVEHFWTFFCHIKTIQFGFNCRGQSGSNSWACRRNPYVWQFQWKRSSSAVQQRSLSFPYQKQSTVSFRHVFRFEFVCSWDWKFQAQTTANLSTTATFRQFVGKVPLYKTLSLQNMG